MNIYCGNLSYKMNDDDLRNLFKHYGSISSAKIIMEKEAGRSKGFGFVEMDSEEEARKAIEELNGALINGRNIRVNEAKPRTDSAVGRGPK